MLPRLCGRAQPFEKALAQGWCVRRSLHTSKGETQREPLAIGCAVQDACVGPTIGDLLPGFGKGVLARADQFVFPADDTGAWEPGTNHR